MHSNLHYCPSSNPPQSLLSAMTTTKTKASPTPLKMKASITTIVIKLKSLASKEPKSLMTLSKTQDGQYSFPGNSYGVRVKSRK